MQSSIPTPGNPWPHDMVITVQNDSQILLELLWVREAWQLYPIGDDLPPALDDAPPLVSASQRDAAPIAEWGAAWPRVWAEALHHAGTPDDPETLARLHDSALGPDERARLLRDFVGPSWRDDVGAEAMTEESEMWMHAQYLRRVERRPRTVEDQPEHAELGAVVSAWRSGLTTIVEIPCAGTFTRRIGPHALLVTTETRADPDRYRAALATFF